jgi:hypothetical protein
MNDPMWHPAGKGVPNAVEYKHALVVEALPVASTPVSSNPLK